MPDHLTITVTDDGDAYRVESDVAATTLGDMCTMLGTLMLEAKRLHDDAHYLDRVKN
jgi:hypothetical protein